AYMPGLVLFSMLFIIQRVFWAMHDHRTPFLMQLVQSGLFVIGALAVAMLPGSVIGVGIAICTTIAGSAQTIVALVLVRKRLGGIEGPVVTLLQGIGIAGKDFHILGTGGAVIFGDA
ncbi:hypothetical protein IAE22_32775, partial [Bacillus sp. S34]|nr:hypothetical protein [Bacillus sp. S34]